MAEASAVSGLSSNLGGRSIEIRTMSTIPDGNDPSHLVPPETERVGYLIRCAMKVMASDLRAAQRCLEDAATLLASDSRERGKRSAPLVAAPQSGGLARWQVKRALTYIEANLASKMEARELADLVSFSKGHFCRAFKRSLGVPPMGYVIIRRVERAKEMLTTTRDQLTDIALACGFTDQSHFNRTFSRMVGTSPGRWRRVIAREPLAGGVASA